MKSIMGIGHVAIRVKDIDRTLDFYVGKLGFPEMIRLDRDGRLWLVYLRITDDQYLEVFPEAVGDRAPEREANGLNHICLEVDGIDRVGRGARSCRHAADQPEEDGRRRQLAGLGRGSGRQPHRAHADGEATACRRSADRTAARARVMTAQMRAGPA